MGEKFCTITVYPLVFVIVAKFGACEKLLSTSSDLYINHKMRRVVCVYYHCLFSNREGLGTSL